MFHCILGKVFPKLRRKGSYLKASSLGSVVNGDSTGSGRSTYDVTPPSDDDCGEDMQATDYVFRIVAAFKPKTLRECHVPLTNRLCDV